MNTSARAICRFAATLVLYIAPLLCLALFLYALGIRTNNNFNFNLFLPLCFPGLLYGLYLRLRKPQAMPHLNVAIISNALAVAAILCASHFNIMVSREVWAARGMPDKFSTCAEHDDAMREAGMPLPPRQD